MPNLLDELDNRLEVLATAKDTNVKAASLIIAHPEIVSGSPIGKSYMSLLTLNSALTVDMIFILKYFKANRQQLLDETDISRLTTLAKKSKPDISNIVPFKRD